jgi:hypothetical protein
MRARAAIHPPADHAPSRTAPSRGDGRVP